MDHFRAQSRREVQGSLSLLAALSELFCAKEGVRLVLGIELLSAAGWSTQPDAGQMKTQGTIHSYVEGLWTQS